MEVNAYLIDVAPPACMQESIYKKERKRGPQSVTLCALSLLYNLCG
jgi:hypothetical protein